MAFHSLQLAHRRWLATCLVLWLFPLSASVQAAQIDHGGKLSNYMAMVHEADRQNREVRISGYCASACTIKLGAKNVCIEPEAILMFHSARDAYGARSAVGNLILTSYYPRPLRKLSNVTLALSGDAGLRMTGLQLIGLGLRKCA